MRTTLALLLASLPLLTACNILSSQPGNSTSPASVPAGSDQPVRLRGTLENTGTVLLHPCAGGAPILLDTSSDPDLMARMVAALVAGDTQPQFIDLRGRKVLSEDGSERLLPEQIYRLEAEGSACADPQYATLVVAAHGNEPGWQVRVMGKGMLIQRQDQPSVVLPYLEESMPDGRMGFTSEANGDRIELWLTPGICTDSMSEARYHLSASLRINQDKPRMGCATLGGARQ